MGKGDNRIKIYNKKIESNLNIEGDLTRVEITKQFDDFDISNIAFFNYDGIFPDLYTNDYLYSFKDYEDKTLFAILYAVQNGLSLNFLTRSYKNKIKKLLEGGNKIKFNSKVVNQIFKKTILSYFLIPGSKIVFK